MNGCVYRTTDDKCEFYSDHGKGIVSYCDFDDCEEKKPSNADRIRSMTDEELAKTIHSTGECPPRECPYAYADLSENGGNITDKQCVECWLDWLKEEVSK